MHDLYNQLRLTVGENLVKENEPMSRHTTFKAGGPAACFVTPDGEDSLRKAIHLCLENKIPYYILGNGSNLLVSDAGYDGVILHMGDAWDYCRVCGETVTAGSGALLAKVAHTACKNSLTGLEFASGIPGSLGGAVVMNAGAYGGEMKQVLQSARVMDLGGEIHTLSGEELDMGYRRSCIPERGYVVLEASLGLKSGSFEKIKSAMDQLAEKRREKQPLEYPSAGSTFKRPEGYFAGKLIEEAGLRGYQVGGAQVSEKHCGFVINQGGATASDIMGLCREVKRRVKENSGVELEMEVKTLGVF